MLARSGLLALLLVAAGPVGAAAAAPAPVTVGSVAAVAGDRAVTVLGEPPRAARVVLRGPGGASTQLATLSPPGAGHANYYEASVAASASTWAVALKSYFISDDDETQERERGELIASGPMAGGPPRTLAACARNEADPNREPIPLTVAGDDVAWSSASCPDATGVRLAPAGGGPVTFIGAGNHPTLTPSWLGYFGVAGDQSTLAVLDRASGKTHVVSTEPSISAFALGDAGVDAVIAPRNPSCFTDCRMSLMRLAADGTLVRPGLAETLNVGTGGPGSSTLVAGGGRVLTSRPHGNGLVAVDLATGAVSYAGALGLDFDGTTPLAVDATSAVFMAPRCDGTNEVRVEPTRANVPARLSSVPCPVRVLARRLTLRRGRRTARLPILCPRGCDESMDVSYRGRLVGSFYAAAPAGVRRRTEVTFDDLPPLRRARRITVTVAFDSYLPSHPLAKRQAPIRVVVRLRG
jgi:hypothetical protein